MTISLNRIHFSRKFSNFSSIPPHSTQKDSMLAPAEFISNKRTRTEFTSAHHTKRPINKSLIAISQDGNDSTDTSTQLFAVTFPCTIVGLRWSLSFFQAAGTAVCLFWWAIVIVRQGVTQATLGVSDGANFFLPESNCLVFGNGSIDNNVGDENFSGTTKTMRKMQGGDSLVFIAKGVGTDTSGVRGVVQFFCKT